MSEINARLDQRFRLLTTGNRTALPRHQTLRALMDWSYDLLGSEEQIVFDRLSVFAGGWTLDAAEAVARCGNVAEWQVLDLLAALVGKSLVQAEVIHGSTRYRLLRDDAPLRRRTPRAAGRLGPAGRPRRPPRSLPVSSRPPPRGCAALTNIVGLTRSRPSSTTSALRWRSASADPDSAEPGLRLATELKWFCYMRGHSGEIIEALSVLLARPDARQPTRCRARALAATCHLLNNSGRNPVIPSMAEEAITIARGLADDFVAGDALCALCWFTFLAGDLPAALAMIDEAVALARSAGKPHLLTTALGHRAAFKGEAGDLDAASADQQEVLALAWAAGDNYVLVITLVNLGLDQIGAGELQAAVASLQEALGVAEAHGYQHFTAGVAANLGFAYLMGADAAGARRLLIGVLDTARATGGRPLCTLPSSASR